MGRLTSMASTGSTYLPEENLSGPRRQDPEVRRNQCAQPQPRLLFDGEALSRGPQKSRCTRGKYRTLAIHTCEPARQRAHALAQTPAFAISQRARRKVEALFAELKNYVGLRRLRLRRMCFVREQFYLAATVQNLKRLVRFLRCNPPSRSQLHEPNLARETKEAINQQARRTKSVP